MQFEDALASTSLGRQVLNVVRSVTAAATAARGAYQLTRGGARGTSPARMELQAQQIVQQVLRAGMSIRSAAVPPPDRNQGAWKSMPGLHPQNPAAQAALRSREARHSRVTAGAGIEPQAYAPYPEITLGLIKTAQSRAHRTGWTDRFQDIVERQCREDSHVRGIDGKLRAWCYKTPLRVRSGSGTPLGVLTANTVRAALDQCDGLISSVAELQVMASAGYSVGELAWRDARLSIPGVGRVPLEIVSSVEQVLPRNIVFDIVTDAPWLVMGAGNNVEIQEPGLDKFIFLKGGPEGGVTRFRGYGWANSWLSYLGSLTLEKFGTLVEVFGLVVPYLQQDESGYLSDDENAHAIEILENLGTGRPEVIPKRYGELKHSPVPAGLAPIHAQMLGLVKTEQSKLILGSTLAVEIGNVGSQAAATVHSDGVVDRQRVFAGIIAEGLRSQVVRYFLEANKEALCAAFNSVPGINCTPDDIAEEPVVIEWPLSDETPAQRLAVFQGVKGLGYDLDESQVRAELGVLAPLAHATPAAPAAPPPASVPAAAPPENSDAA